MRSLVYLEAFAAAQLGILAHKTVAALVYEPTFHASEDTVQLHLVESLPIGECTLNSTVPSTYDTLLQAIQSTNTRIDISSFYWNYLGIPDKKTYSPIELERLGANRGLEIYRALQNALARNVRLKVLTAHAHLYSNFEIQSLAQMFPKLVTIREWDAMNWFGGGILHQKLWIFDGVSAYIGSANNDWKSLAQVLELGIFLQDNTVPSKLMQDVQQVFNVYWHWADENVKTQVYFNQEYQSKLRVPCWSEYVPLSERTCAKNPFVNVHRNFTALYNLQNQLIIREGTTLPFRIFISSAPMEATVNRSRTFDQDALLYTIQSATKFVYISVMDYLFFSTFPLETQKSPIYWPALYNAIMTKIYAAPSEFTVRLLVSQWLHTNPIMLQSLRQILQLSNLCKLIKPHSCLGNLEIKVFRVKGWNITDTRYPAYTRVNHAKYIVSDQRANIGTSNFEWSYFYTTAGISVNTDADWIRNDLIRIFLRNWESDYASSL